jgi:hypothetical protein
VYKRLKTYQRNGCEYYTVDILILGMKIFISSDF